MIHRFVAALRRRSDLLFLAVLSYVPTLCLSEGKYNADTKLYLTSDAARLISRSRYAWDPSQFGGYVPHQAVGYLWPMGPFYWVFHLAHFPAWIAQRAWVATLFFLASAGIVSLCRMAGFSRTSAIVAALAYQFTPYVLAYQSRTSALLLPWVGLPWIILAVYKGLSVKTWRYPALIALVVASVGGINATSLIMIAAAPVLLILEQITTRQVSWRSAAKFTFRAGALSLLASLWWIAMVALQGKYGGDVLTFSETVEAVSSTSTAPEVFRGLGYWLNYVVTPAFNGTTHALDYLKFTLPMVLSFVVPALGVLGLLCTSSPFRRISSWWLFCGVFLSVGVHPLHDSPPVLRFLADHPSSTIALALRSSTRAIPIALLAISLGLASLMERMTQTLRQSTENHVGRSFRQVLAFAVAVVLVVLVVPSRFVSGASDPAMAHSAIPPYWKSAGAALDSALRGQARIVQLPGQEFGAYTWGYTVDPVLPAVVASPVLTRDLLPLGNPQVMDLMNALDDSARLGTLTRDGLGQIAELMGAGAIVLPHDLDLDRFGTYSPGVLQQNLHLAKWTSTGTPPRSVSAAFFPGNSVARLETGDTIVDGNGAGLVAIANAGLRLGHVAYAGDMSDVDIRAAVAAGARVIVTDSYRIVAQQWRGSLDTTGFSEDGRDRGTTVEDSADRRLDVFPSTSRNVRTLVRQTSRAFAVASSYGYPLGYWPEARAALAVDGRPDTAWTTSAFGNPLGESITLHLTNPIDRLFLRQPAGRRWINAIEVRLNNESRWMRYTLDQRDRLSGQLVSLPRPATDVTVRIASVVGASDFTLENLNGVGFSEMLDSSTIADEETIVSNHVVGLLDETTRPTFVFTRLSAPRSSWWRSDPEVRFSRTFASAATAPYRITVSASINVSDEPQAAAILGRTTYADGAESADFAHAGWNATDGDITTSWRTRFGQTQVPVLTFLVNAPTDHLVMKQCDASTCNSIVNVRLTDGSGSTFLRTVDDDGKISTSGLAPGRWFLHVLSTSHRTTRDHRFGLTIELPLEVFDIRPTNPGWMPAASTRVTTSPQLSLNGAPLEPIGLATVDRNGKMHLSYSATLSKGSNTLHSRNSAVLIDTAVLTPFSDTGSWPIPSNESLMMTGSPVSRRIAIPPHEVPGKLVFGEGFSDGWSAHINGKELSGHRRVDGGFNSWDLPASTSEQTVTVTFTPQRTANIAQILSLMTVVFCCLVVVGSRRRTGRTVLTRAVDKVSATTLKSRGVAALLVLVGSITFVSPGAFPLALVLSAIVLAARSTRVMVSASCVALLYPVVRSAVRIYARQPAPRFDWPAITEAFHRPLLVALLLIVVVVTLTGGKYRPN